MSSHTDILACRNPELWLVTASAHARSGGGTTEPTASGMIATSVTSVSIVPEMPRILVAISHQHLTSEIINQCGVFTLHVLGEDNVDLVWHFGLQSGRDGAKLADVSTRSHSVCRESAEMDFLIVPECVSWVACRVEAKFDIGDRSLFVAEVVDAERFRDCQAPLTMRRLAEIGAPEKLSQLREQSARHAIADQQAIAAWRESERSQGRLDSATL